MMTIYLTSIWVLIFCLTYFAVVSLIAALGFLLYGGRWVFRFLLTMALTTSLSFRLGQQCTLVFKHLEQSVLSIMFTNWSSMLLYMWIIICNFCRLFYMLRRFPIESKGRRKKLHEVNLWNHALAFYVTIKLFPYWSGVAYRFSEKR